MKDCCVNVDGKSRKAWRLEIGDKIQEGDLELHPEKRIIPVDKNLVGSSFQSSDSVFVRLKGK